MTKIANKNILIALSAVAASLGLWLGQTNHFGKIGQRQPASAPGADLGADLRAFNTTLGSAEFDGKSCAPIFSGFYETLRSATAASFDHEGLDTEALPLVDELFRTRLAIRKRLRDLMQASAYGEDCSVGARDLFRALRFAEEYLAEWKLKPAAFDTKKPAPYLEGASPYLMVNPAYAGFSRDRDLRSGDLLMSRGNAFTSAAIARLSDVPAQFSHVAVLYIDPSGQKWVSEAHIEIGSKVRKFEEYLNDQNMRVVVFRQADAELAARSAKFIHDKVKGVSDSTGKNIPYDFHMNLYDHTEVFCSEMAEWAFEEGSSKSFMIPLFQSRFTMKNRDVLDRLGITTRQSFAPGDLEVDPRFDLVAEWRDISRSRDTRVKDAVLASFFDWGNRYGYVLQDDMKSWMYEIFIWRARRWPLFDHLLDQRFPLNMGQELLGTFTVLNDLAELLQNYADEHDAAHFAKTGFYMTNVELVNVLEEFRERDWKAYVEANRRQDKPRPVPGHFKFHDLYRPRGT